MFSIVRSPFFSIISVLLILSACGGSGGSSPTSDGGTTPGWILNSGADRSMFIFESGTSTGVLVNIESVISVKIGSVDYTQITTSGVPDYSVTLTDTDIATLNGRPDAAGDFRNLSSTTSASVGDTVAFGADIGYDSSTKDGSCASTGGFGYWPPGPDCPSDKNKMGNFSHAPTVATVDCKTGLGPMGYMANGTSVYNWGDGTSYNNENVWELNAPVAEQYDVDICGGHAANGDYHHHFHSACLEATIVDDGTSHSPVFGYAADGYPIHGKWHADTILAKPSWVVRDYSDVSATTSGCPAGVAGERSCILVDQYNLSAGVTTLTTTAGPSTSGTYMTQSGSAVPNASGLFFQDFYHDSALVSSSAEYLDEYNGHNHDSIGYHYHIAVEVDEVTPKFPYILGPNFYGDLDSNAITSCGATGPAGAP